MQKIKTKQAVLVVLSLVLAAIIMSVSLVATGKLQSNDTARLATRKLYFKGDILPDHLFYPVLMARDRLVLTLASDSKKIPLQIKFAYQRLDSAHQLFDKGENQLALSTLTKSQKYMLTAAQLVMSTPDQTLEKRQDTANEIDQLLQKISECMDKHPDIEGHEVDRLIDELKTMQVSLRN